MSLSCFILRRNAAVSRLRLKAFFVQYFENVILLPSGLYNYNKSTVICLCFSVYHVFFLYLFLKYSFSVVFRYLIMVNLVISVLACVCSSYFGSRAFRNCRLIIFIKFGNFGAIISLFSYIVFFIPHLTLFNSLHFSPCYIPCF